MEKNGSVQGPRGGRGDEGFLWCRGDVDEHSLAGSVGGHAEAGGVDKVSEITEIDGMHARGAHGCRDNRPASNACRWLTAVASICSWCRIAEMILAAP